MQTPQSFNHTHYVPILKGKRGEFDALRHIYPQDKAALTPVFEIPVVDWDYDNDVAKKAETAHVDNGLDGMLRGWGTARPFFIDPQPADLSNPIAGDAQTRHPYTYVFAAARARGLLAVPVVPLAPDPTTLTAVQAIAATDGRGVMVRVERERLNDPTIFAALAALPSLLGLPPSQIDLLLDYEEVTAATLGAYLFALPQWLPQLPHLAAWRTLTLAGCGMPPNLSGLQAGVLHSVPRTEWALWAGLLPHLLGKTRVPTFSDYGIAFVDIPEIDPRFMKPLHNIRYTTTNEWLIIKGQSLKTGQGMPTPQMCAVLVGQHAFCGPGFSAGDKHIADCAAGQTGPGNMTTWRQVGTNHHLTFVVRSLATQLASLVPTAPVPATGQGASTP